MECKVLNPTQSHFWSVWSSQSFRPMRWHSRAWGSLIFLGHLVEWTLKSFLIPFLEVSFADHKTYRRKGYNGQRHQWAKRFSSCQVYWALFSVVAMSCKFPIREKQSISAICEYKYEGSTSLRFFSIANVSGFRSFDTASFRMLYIHWRGFLAGGSHVLLLRGFQQFYNFFSLSNIQKIQFLAS